MGTSLFFFLIFHTKKSPYRLKKMKNIPFSQYIITVHRKCIKICLFYRQLNFKLAYMLEKPKFQRNLNQLQVLLETWLKYLHRKDFCDIKFWSIKNWHLNIDFLNLIQILSRWWMTKRHYSDVFALWKREIIWKFRNFFYPFLIFLLFFSLKYFPASTKKSGRK